MSMASTAIEDPGLRAAFGKFNAALETALMLAARHNWSAQEALTSLRDDWEAETLDNAGELARHIEELFVAAMVDGEVSADERQAILEVLDGFSRLARALRQYDERENAEHETARQSIAETRRHLRQAMAPVSANLRTLNHKRGGRGQALPGLEIVEQGS